MEDDLKNLGIDELMKRLGTTKDGLSSEEAKRRLEKFGYNEVVEKERTHF